MLNCRCQIASLPRHYASASDVTVQEAGADSYKQDRTGWVQKRCPDVYLLGIVQLGVFGVEEVKAPAVELQRRYLFQDRMELAVGRPAQLPHLHMHAVCAAGQILGTAC